VVACAVVPLRVNWNRNSHFREFRLSAGANFHFLAAAVARWAKYLLGPGFSRVSFTTLPELLTLTRTVTLISPRIVSRALRGTAGISSWSTEGDALAGLGTREPALAAGAGTSGGADTGVRGFREAGEVLEAGCFELGRP
jgi:hypothetical protein